MSNLTSSTIGKAIPWGALGISLIVHLTGIGIGAAILIVTSPIEPEPQLVISTDVEPSEQPATPLAMNIRQWQPVPAGGSPNPLAAATPSDINTDSVLSSQSRIELSSGESLNFTELVGDGGTGGGTGAGEGTGDGEGFFGLDLTGDRIVFVVDASRSMAAPYPGDAKNRLGRVKFEIYNAVSRMTTDQRFFVVFFNSEPIPMPAQDLISPEPTISRPYMEWIFKMRPIGQTDPEAALLLALRLRPDRIYFLTDGYFSPGTVRTVREANNRRVPIHTVGFGGKEGEKNLQAIARDSQASYQYIPTPEMPAEPDKKPAAKSVSPLQKAAAAIAKPE